MLKAQKGKKGQQGFTLIEIIAVLVILGILAAVAVPKYVDLQKQAAAKAMSGAVAALKSQASMDYAAYLLANPASPSSWATTVTGLTIGDYTGAYTAKSADNTVTVGVTAGPANFAEYSTLKDGSGNNYSSGSFYYYK